MPKLYLDDSDDLSRDFRPDFGAANARFIDPVSGALNHALSAGQKVTGLNVPLASFENPAIDDLQRDLYWATYLANSFLKDKAPSGREVVRALLEWVLSDPTFKIATLPLVNHKVSAAASAYGMTEQLMQMPDVQAGMSGLGEADGLDAQADALEARADQAEADDESGDYEGESEAEKHDGEPGLGEEQDGSGSGDESEGDDSGSEDDDDEGDLDWDADRDWDDDDESDEDWDGGDGQDELFDDDRSPQDLRDLAQDLRDQAAQKRAEAQERIEQALGNSLNEFGRSGSIKVGADFGEELMVFLSSWGVDEGQGLMMDPREIVQMMRSLSAPGIGGLTSLVGRVHGIAEKTLRGRAPVEVVVETAGFTKDLMAMHPGERFKLTRFYPYREQAIEDWLRAGLGGVAKTLQAVREGNFVCFVDESGSMDTMEVGGRRETIAKALALGLAKAARENGQEFMLAGFGTHGQVTEVMDIRTSLPDLLDWASNMFNGGTSFDFALVTAMDLVDGLDDEERYKTDFVFITDGQSEISDEVKDRLLLMKDEYGVRLFVLMIGSSPFDDIVELADSVLQFNGLDNVAETLSKLIWC